MIGNGVFNNTLYTDTNNLYRNSLNINEGA